MVEKPGGKFTIIGTHCLPPVSGRYFASRNAHLKALAGRVMKTRGPVVVAGDLNTSMWSVHYRDLVERSGLRNARKGHGLLPTWPSGATWLLRIPIDHVLHSHHFTAASARTAQIQGSDHLALIVDLESGGSIR